MVSPRETFANRMTRLGASVVIGVPLAATGNLNQEGAMAKQGYDLWLDWVNGTRGGIEVGGGTNIGTETYAASVGQWSHAQDTGNVATPSGKSFSALIASLGGPAGIVEG